MTAAFAAASSCAACCEGTARPAACARPASAAEIRSSELRRLKHGVAAIVSSNGVLVGQDWRSLSKAEVLDRNESMGNGWLQ
mmetsp:Transcript_65527/g.185860  ORF Transcript_65527/g.185860 Transcript_65527/m.185860 type:complete len:82 (+) Transcript_65527:1601-1846(+)